MNGSLPAGLQGAQCVHAAFQFTQEHPDLAFEWFEASNFLILVSVPDEGTLLELADRAAALPLRTSLVREPDLGGAATALAIEPSILTRKLCASLPLALREAVAA